MDDAGIGPRAKRRRRWVCPCTGRVMLMRYHELIDVILEDAMPG